MQEARHRMNMPKDIRGVIFDLDDTLVESTVNYAKFKRLVIDKIVSWGGDRSMYSPSETIVAITARYESSLRAQKVPDSVMKRRLAELDRIMDEVELERVHETKAIQGALSLLEYLRAKGVKIGILTRGCAAYAKAALSEAGMIGLVDALECRNSETRAKPDPDAYLKLVRKIDVPKEETVFVGDHQIDAECARNAGVAFIGVGTGDVPEAALREAGSTIVVRDVGELVPVFRSLLGD